MTPVAFFIGRNGGNYATERFLDWLIEYGKPRLTQLFSRWSKKRREPAVVVTVTLTAEPAGEVRRFTQWGKRGKWACRDTTASVVADAVVGARTWPR